MARANAQAGIAPSAATPPAPPASAAPAPVALPKWEPDIRRFEAADRKNPPPQNAVLFIGASSIRLWKTLKQDFPGAPTINRGFGGSQIADSTRYADRIVVPYHPREIVFFGGDNDLSSHHTPEQVAADFAGFVDKVRSELPDVPIVLISIKPSLSRVGLKDKQIEANRLLADYCARAKNVTFVDVYTPMLDADGKPRPELFIKDGLHMNAAGYAIWTEKVRPLIQPDAVK